MTSSPDHSLLTNTENRLHALIDRGFQFIHPTDAAGQVIAVVGIRVHDNVVDVVRLNAEDDVLATRMPGTEPDILAPSTVLWQSTGAAPRVLDDLLALPDDRTPSAANADELVDTSGCWVPVRAGTSAWVTSRS